jgi:large subunit ribosomal protein L10
MVKSEKVEAVESLKKSFENSSLAVCVDFRGVNVEQISKLRSQLKAQPVEYKVVKNTLARLAVQNTSYQPLEQFFTGPTGIAFCGGDTAASIKILTKFAKDIPNFQIKGGVINGIPVDSQQIEKVSNLPPREILLAEVVGAMQSPITNLVWTLESIIGQLVYILQEIVDKKGKSQ